MKGITLICALFAALAMLASCNLSSSEGTTAVTTPSAQDIANFQKVFMSSYFAERGGTPHSKALTPFLRHSVESRATVPLAQLPSGVTWTTVKGNTSAQNTIANYPEPGQTSVFLVTNGPITNVFDVKVTTTFPSDDLRKTYVEEYYVKDVTPGNDNVPDTLWTIDDPIVDSTGARNPLARVQLLLTFQDGTTRSETIVSVAGPGQSPRFDPVAFNVNGSLDLTQAFLPNLSSDANVMFSSVVIYSVTPSVNYNFWFWQGSSAQTIIGVRYYTEKQDTVASTYTAYTASFEKTLNTLTTTGGTYATTVQGVFVNSQYNALAESVIRQQITYSLKTGGSYNTADLSKPAVKITNMQTRVVNLAGLPNSRDFYLQQLNSDVAQLSHWATSTIYIPTGNVTEILASNSSAFAFSRTGLTNTGVQPIAVQTVDISGLGALATVYTSIQESTATASPSVGITLPTSNLLPLPNTEYVYGGQNMTGTTLPNTGGRYDLSTKGTVEAWVYITVMTDTAGIIHKGVKADFTDECYTLQGWGSGGKIAFAIDGPGGNYDIATSDIKLNVKKWYYLVGTWDTTAATPYINLYINGVLHGSARPYNAASGAQVNSSDLLIGSQLPVQYNTTWGYFGLNGKIVGANVSAIPMTVATALANYNQYSASTANW
jgi:hypothetical protein